jgi:hypothetical protein
MDPRYRNFNGLIGLQPIICILALVTVIIAIGIRESGTMF